MSLKIQTIFSTLEPYRIARDLGLDIKTNKDQCFIGHPTISDSVIWLTDKEFISLNDGCTFVAGDVFDFLAFYLGDYEQAVDHVLKRYIDRADTHDRITVETTRAVFVNQLSMQRTHFLNLLSLRNNLYTRAVHYSDADMWLSNRSLILDHCFNMVYAAHGSELNALLGGIKDVPQFSTLATYMVFPYFSDYHTFSRLVVQDVTKLEPEVVDLEPARHAFFGLHTVQPHFEDVRVTSTPTQALFNYSQSRHHGNFDFGIVQPHFDNMCRASQMHLRTGTFITARDFDLGVVAKHRGGFANYYVASEVNSIQSVYRPDRTPWLEYALLTFREMCCEDDDISPRVGHLLDDLRFDPELGEIIINWMVDIKRPEMAKKARKHLISPRTFSVSDAEMQETPSGYIYRKTGSKHTVQASNFIIRLTASVYFIENKALFQYGVMIANDVEYDICLPSTVTTRADKLVEALTAAVLTQTEGKSNFRPALYDSAAKKYIIHVLSEQMSHQSYHSTVGLYRLGWDAHHPVFNSPTWTASSTGLDTTPRVGYPSSDTLQRHYVFTPLVLSETTDLVTPQIKTFLALQASLITRLYFKQPFPIVSVLNNLAGLQLLTAIFVPLGQVQPLELNVNQRSSVSLVADEVANYPVFGNTQVNLDGRMGYVFALSRSGLPVLDVFDKDLYEQTLTMAYLIQTQLVLAILRDRQALFSHLTEEPKSQLDYILEGRRLIEALTQYKQFDVFNDDLPCFRGVMSHIAFEDVSKYFRLDLPSGTVFMNFTKISEHQRQDVYRELSAKHDSVTMFKKHYLVLNAEFITDLLGKFYGKAVKIFAAKDSEVGDDIISVSQSIRKAPEDRTAACNPPETPTPSDDSGSCPADQSAVQDGPE